MRGPSRLHRLFLILLQHPHFQTGSPLTLLGPNFSDYDISSHSPSLDSDTAHMLQHPDLHVLLLALYTVFQAIPYFPLMPSIVKNYGSPVPPNFLMQIMSSHPLVGMRRMAWLVISAWLGWDGPRKQEMHRTYVYDPEKDPNNGADGTPKQLCPMPDFSKPMGEGDEYILYWQTLAGVVKRGSQTGRVHVPVRSDCIDCWVFEQHFARSRATDRGRSYSTSQRPYPSSNPLVVTVNDMTPFIVDIEGMHMVREVCLHSAASEQSDFAHLSTETFVITATASVAMRQLAAHVSARSPVLLSSVAAAGKSAVLNELYDRLYRNFDGSRSQSSRIVYINLADRSLDAKTLLGTLSSSSTEPGTFTFVEGSLTRALREGKWLVFEDIDKAADDVLSTVAELVERMRRRLHNLPGGGWGGAGQDAVGVLAAGRWVEAGEGFMLFATRSVQHRSAISDPMAPAPKATYFGHQYWSDIWLDLPQIDEIRKIAQTCAPKTSPQILSQMVDVWQNVSAATKTAAGPSGSGSLREIGIRDLLRWCRRVESHVSSGLHVTTIDQNPTFQEEVLCEAIDLFLGSYAEISGTKAHHISRYATIMTLLQKSLMLNEERVQYIVHKRTPELVVPADEEWSTLYIGRATVQRMSQRTVRSSASQDRPYATTKPFLRLCEKIAVCIQQREPVLLVGETGTGKTTAVSNLARLARRKLVSLNLSNQTEASDLLGGFKPVNEAEETQSEFSRCACIGQIS